MYIDFPFSITHHYVKRSGGSGAQGAAGGDSTDSSDSSASLSTSKQGGQVNDIIADQTIN